MRKTYPVVLVIILCAIFSSCQKESQYKLTEENDNNTSLLKKIITLDTTKAAPLDTLQYSAFFYDNSGRAVSGYTVFLRNNVPDTSLRWWFFYSGSDSLPYKRVFHEHWQSGWDMYDTTYYQYNSNGNIVYDSLCDRQGYPSSWSRDFWARNFTVSGNGVIEITRYYDDDPYSTPWYDTAVYNQQKSLGNILYQFYTSPFEEREYVNSFDNHYNPYFKAYPRRYMIIGSGYEGDVGESKNNPVESKCTITDWSGAHVTDHYKYSYEYDSNGFPAIVRVQILADQYSTGPFPQYLKHIYQYY